MGIGVGNGDVSEIRMGELGESWDCDCDCNCNCK
jgi:hypothetical protein